MANNSHSSEKKWKYVSIGLMAVLAVGFSFPQALGDITSNINHMLNHIYNFTDGIEAKTNNLPADPASNTVVNTRASQTSVNSLQTTTNTIKANSLSQIVNQEIIPSSFVYTIFSDRPYIVDICASNVLFGSESGAIVLLKVPKTGEDSEQLMLANAESGDTKCIVASNTDVGFDLWLSLDATTSWQGMITVQAPDDAVVTITPRSSG